MFHQILDGNNGLIQPSLEYEGWLKTLLVFIELLTLIPSPLFYSFWPKLPKNLPPYPPCYAPWKNEGIQVEEFYWSRDLIAVFFFPLCNSHYRFSGCVLGCSGCVLGGSGRFWVCSGCVLGGSGPVLGRFWTVLGIFPITEKSLKKHCLIGLVKLAFELGHQQIGWYLLQWLGIHISLRRELWTFDISGSLVLNCLTLCKCIISLYFDQNPVNPNRASKRVIILTVSFPCLSLEFHTFTTTC